MPSTPFSHWSAFDEVHDQIYTLRHTVTLLGILRDGLNEAPNDCETEAWRELAVFGLQESVERLRGSIDDLLALVSAHQHRREHL